MYRPTHLYADEAVVGAQSSKEEADSGSSVVDGDQ